MRLMFHLKYALYKTYWFFAKPIRLGYRFFTRPTRKGVKVIVVKNGKVVLVRPNYAHRTWTLSGGMVDIGETYEDAARREVLEETGLRIESLSFVREYESTANFVHNIVTVFASTTNDTELTVDGIEIKEAAWFPLDALPADRVSRVDETLAAYKPLITI